VAGQKLGQHFLNNPAILERLAAAVCPAPEPVVLEIGPGRGALTEFLLPRAGRVIAIELDPALAAHVRARFPGVEVVESDVLTADLGQWGPVAVAGNLPYYITSPILERIFALGPLLKRAVVLVQLEVAERLVAQPGTRDYGFLTVETQVFTRPEMLFRVPPGAFSPPPKVDSAAVLLTPRPAPVEDVPGFLEFAGRCFRHKRKTLRNNLLPFYGRKVEAWPEAGLRAEQAPLEKLIELYSRTRF
jgi:16S rRNA (adenine1518-N6/adenine1519-N6)-dimethyltransferase